METGSGQTGYASAVLKDASARRVAAKPFAERERLVRLVVLFAVPPASAERPAKQRLPNTFRASPPSSVYYFPSDFRLLA